MANIWLDKSNKNKQLTLLLDNSSKLLNNKKNRFTYKKNIIDLLFNIQELPPSKLLYYIPENKNKVE